MSFLTDAEVDALIATPDPRPSSAGATTLLLTAVQTGLRVSELAGLCCGDVFLGAGAHIRCVGKGRKQRAKPLTSRTVEVLRVWLRET